MKHKPFLLLWLILFPLSLYTQEADLQFDPHVKDKVTVPYDVGEYFLLLPDSIFNDLPFLKKGTMSADFRAELLASTQRDSWESGWPYYLATRDLRNGYLRMNSVGDGEGAYLEMCYWNCPDGGRLIAVNVGQWAMCCEESTVSFFHFEADEWTRVPDPMPAIQLSDFLKTGHENLQPALEAEDVYLAFQLPHEGKDIGVHFDVDSYEYHSFEPPLEPDAQMKWLDQFFEFVEFSSLELKWDGCKFEKVIPTVD